MDDIQHSSDSQVSNFSLGDIEDENGNKRNGLNENNSFLHDNELYGKGDGQDIKNGCWQRKRRS